MCGLRVIGGLGPVLHAIVPRHIGDPQAIAGKDVSAAFGLRRAVFGQGAPFLHCRLIPPEGERQELARLVEAFEPFYRKEAVDLLQQRL